MSFKPLTEKNQEDKKLEFDADQDPEPYPNPDPLSRNRVQ